MEKIQGPNQVETDKEFLTYEEVASLIYKQMGVLYELPEKAIKLFRFVDKKRTGLVGWSQEQVQSIFC